MKAFSYTSPESWSDGAKALRSAPAALPKGAGTDLLDLMKEGVVQPPELVNVLRIPLSKGSPDSLGAQLTLASLAADPHVHKHYPALATAAEEAATPQIRNRATLGGNLCQLSRCAYLRTSHPCLKVGDALCSAAQPGAHTRFSGIFPRNGCMSAHASNVAPALMALGATVEVTGPSKTRTLSVDELYTAPKAGVLGDTVLTHDELVSRVNLQPSAFTRNSVYLEVRERQSFDFALASVAVALEVKGGKITKVGIGCGGVATTPYRPLAAEKLLLGKGLDDAVFTAAAAAAVKGATPTAKNGHKVVLLQRLLVRALKQLRDGGSK